MYQSHSVKILVILKEKKVLRITTVKFIDNKTKYHLYSLHKKLVSVKKYSIILKVN